MNPTQENGNARARKVMEKMKNPKMLEIMNGFTEELGVTIPSRYRWIFTRSWELYNKKQGPFGEITKRPKYSHPEKLYNMINGEVQEKFHAVCYHMQNAAYLQKLVDEYTNQLINTAKEIGIDWPITVGITLRKLYFEYEAFILQARACLDHFIVSLSYYFGFYTIKIDSFKRKLEEFSGKNPKAEKVLDLMNKPRKFYELVKSKTREHPSSFSDRDRIAHCGYVLMRPLNVMINPISGTKVLPVARHEKGEDTFDLSPLIELMESLMHDLFSFIIEIYAVIFAD